MEIAAGVRKLFRRGRSRSESPMSTLSPKHRRLSLRQDTTTDQSSHLNVNSAQSAASQAPPTSVISEGQSYGIKVLYDGGAASSVDIVFVHGICSDGEKDRKTRAEGSYSLLTALEGSSFSMLSAILEILQNIIFSSSS